MKKRGAKMLVVALSLMMLISSVSANAIDGTIEGCLGEDVALTEFGTETIDKLSQIPMYITYIDKTDSDTFERIKVEANQTISNYEKQVTMVSVNESDSDSTVLFDSDSYRIERASSNDLKTIIDNPLFCESLRRVCEMVDQGTEINHINAYLPTGATVFENDSYERGVTRGFDDESYWLQNTLLLGYYDGYHFRYSDMSVSVESNVANLGTSYGTWNWSNIIYKVFEIGVECFKNANFLQVIVAAVGEISDLLDFYEPPISVTLGESGSYIKGQVSGDLYMRTVYIEDELDRVSGYAYYSWGYAEKLCAAMRLDAKWPKARTNGVYLYEYPSCSYPVQDSYTEGYANKYTLFDQVIALYENTMGYFYYREYIDVMSAVASLRS